MHRSGNEKWFRKIAASINYFCALASVSITLDSQPIAFDTYVLSFAPGQILKG